MSALDTLLGVYAGRPAAPRPADAPVPVIGHVGADVPVELITAAGALPLRLSGGPGEDTADGDRYLGRGVDPAARSTLTRLLAGRWGRLDGLVVARDCEASLRLFYALRELRRTEPATALPPVHLADVLHLPHRTTTRYDLRRLRELRDRLATWTGGPIGDDALAAAVAAHDESRRLLAAAAAELRRRSPARVTGREWLAIVGAGTVLPVHAYNGLLERLLAEAAELPRHDGVRVFMTGSGHDSPEVYERVESTGRVIVGEDHDWGDLLFERRVGGRTPEALAERYQYNGPTAPRASIRARARYTAMAVERCGAEELVSCCREHDEAAAWDFPAQREAAGVPSVLVERQPYGAIDTSAFETSAFRSARTGGR
ncbi:benzoyl-CoA reductase [Actinomadura sp. CNU-125]|uniref:2-hydroxyacyl-CoA dehydratase family protein n=1 Tax=Actinomadura sp. CNU-125 TaxID=1904961 RepID=UPI000962E646|nr:2-hydroxyacyl-CoA dehydratase family protein [Actinomadura sp. CNU-125]OLT14134.1 benzoyl-CoA reductase [Actinomadura sp. CNU-125]